MLASFCNGIYYNYTVEYLNHTLHYHTLLYPYPPQYINPPLNPTYRTG